MNYKEREAQVMELQEERNRLLAMEPGRELDAEIALRMFKVKEVTVVGKHYFIDPLDKILPSYSTNISSAWEVYQAIRDRSFWIGIDTYSDKLRCLIISRADDLTVEHLAETAPEAICKAALLAVMDQTSETAYDERSD